MPLFKPLSLSLTMDDAILDAAAVVETSNSLPPSQWRRVVTDRALHESICMHIASNPFERLELDLPGIINAETRDRYRTVVERIPQGRSVRIRFGLGAVVQTPFFV